jgi:hypothetical protein
MIFRLDNLSVIHRAHWSSPGSVDDLRLGIQAVHCGGCGLGIGHILLS